MKASDRRRIERRIREWRGRLGLTEWNIKLMDSPPLSDDGRIGETLWDYSTRDAEVRLAPEVIGRDDEAHTIVHELLHITEGTARMSRYLHDVARKDQGNLSSAYEQMIDDAARYLVRMSEARGRAQRPA